jgi:TolB-like protein/Tfp pilus assembly protein PilF
MSPERFKTLDRLYHDALEVEPEQRADFLQRACDGDVALQREIESLLALTEDAGDFIQKPAMDIVAQSLVRDLEGMVDLANGAKRRLQPSQLVAGRFEIIEFIGHGGMGDVYEAKDIHLGGRIALKTIRSEFASDERMIARFKHEILLAKRVTHPNVCRIYDVVFEGIATGEQHTPSDLNSAGRAMFLTMELLRGETLSSRLQRGRMTRAEALPLIEQMAAGLNAAHQAGVVHRDFKSANVMLVGGEHETTRVVITDFGLARKVQIRPDETLTTAITEQGQVAGTPDYMAPEQILGAEPTPAVDIYALGVVMYKMLTGKRPFEADTPLAIAAKHLHEDPLPPRQHTADMDRTWESVILRCLEREPSRRFGSAAEVVPALKGRQTAPWPVYRSFTRRKALYAGVAAAGSIAGSVAIWRLFQEEANSLAVLPFTTTNADLEYLSDGVTEDLINALGQAPRLRVMSRAAVYRYRGINPVLPDVGSALKVRYVLTGRVAKAGDYTAIKVELTDARTGVHVWGQQYERRISEISAVEEDISKEVLRKLQLPLGSQDVKSFAFRRGVSPEANEFYWKGRFFWNKRTQEGFRKGIEYFTMAIEKDPEFALAYTGLADCYAMQSGITPPMEVFPKAKAAAERALHLDETLAEAHASVGFIRLFFDWDWLQTEKEYKRAIQLNLNYASAHSNYAMYLLVMKRFKESLAEMKRALELDPASLAINTGVGRVIFFSRRYREAADQYTKTLEMNSEFSEALLDLGRTRAFQGNYDSAIALLERGIGTAHENAGALADIAYTHRRAGRHAEAERAVRSLEALSNKRYVSRYFFAVAYSGARDSLALDFLEEAFRERAFSMIYLDVDPRFDNLRNHPRYTSLLKRMGFTG